MSQGNYYKAAAVVLVVALLLRIIWAVFVPVAPVSDSVAYDILARTIAEHHVYGWDETRPSAYWPVGTSAIYAAVYGLFGHDFRPIVAINIGISLGIVVTTMALARRLFDEVTALVAGGLTAIWPSQVAYVTILASELPFTLLLLLGLIAWLNVQLPSGARGLYSGLAWAGAMYVRPIVIFLPIVLLAACATMTLVFRKQIVVSLAALLIMGIAVAPWAVRNSILFDHLVFMSTNGGTNLWMGNNENSDGFYMPLPSRVEGLNEYDREKLLGDEAKRYITSQPITFVFRTAKKAAMMHFGETIAVHWNAEGIKKRWGENALYPFKIVTQSYWIGILSLALIGFCRLLNQQGLLRTITNPVILTWAYLTAIPAVFVIQDRYHFPAHPFVAILAAVTIAAALKSDRCRLLIGGAWQRTQIARSHTNATASPTNRLILSVVAKITGS